MQTTQDPLGSQQDPSRDDADGCEDGADEPALPTFVTEAEELLQAAKSMRDGDPEPKAYMRVQAIVRGAALGTGGGSSQFRQLRRRGRRHSGR